MGRGAAERDEGPWLALRGLGGSAPDVCVAPPPPPCPHRVLAEAVVHFPPTLAEVTLGAGPGGKISLRNYVEDDAGEP